MKVEEQITADLLRTLYRISMLKGEEDLCKKIDILQVRLFERELQVPKQ